MPEGRVPDYGCGAGQIVALLRASGIDAWGCADFYNVMTTRVRFQRPHLTRITVTVIPYDDR
jgi:hypothetical protein